MRIPDEHAEIYKQRAEDLGIPLSSWIALTLAEHESLPIPGYVREEILKAKRERLLVAMELELDMPQSA